MHKIEEHIAGMLGADPFRRYFIACSGGLDSMTITHILHKLGYKISLIHVNYLLRGDASELDQQFVEEYCAGKELACHVKRVDLKRYLDEAGGNLQDQARKVRYSYFETFKVKKDHFVVLGQHADDQVETFLLNLSRGGGIMGLSAMLPEHNRYLRPLLPFSREEILNYAIREGISWREDESNSRNDYNRNKLRNLILPELKKTFPDLNEQVLTLVSAFQQTQKCVEDGVRPIVKRILKEQVLSISELRRLNEWERMELLRQLVLPMTIEEELAKLAGAEKGKRIELHGQHFKGIIRESDHLYFAKSEKSFIVPKLIISKAENLPEDFNKMELYLDPEKVKGELELRPWRPGDRMKPLGMKGSKLISDILTDARVPHHLRSSQLVLKDDEKILWCVGFAIGREAVATTGSGILKVILDYPFPPLRGDKGGWKYS